MRYRLSGYGRDWRGYYVQVWRPGRAAVGEPNAVTRLVRIRDKARQDRLVCALLGINP
jgi:hypothetical protein